MLIFFPLQSFGKDLIFRVVNCLFPSYCLPVGEPPQRQTLMLFMWALCWVMMGKISCEKLLLRNCGALSGSGGSLKIILMVSCSQRHKSVHGFLDWDLCLKGRVHNIVALSKSH